MTTITLNEARRADVVAKQAEYRERYERAAAANVQSVMDDAHYKIVAIGILLKEGSVSFDDAMDEVLRSDDAFRHDLMDNAFAAIHAVNTGDQAGVRQVFIGEVRSDEAGDAPTKDDLPASGRVASSSHPHQPAGKDEIQAPLFTVLQSIWKLIRFPRRK